MTHVLDPNHPLAAAIKNGHVTIQPPVTLPPTADPDAINAVQQLVERLEGQITPTGPTQDPDWYGWLPLRLTTFLAGMLHARQLLGPGTHTFLEVGSGIGTKLVLAHELGWKTAGVERWAPYVTTSLTVAPFAHHYAADALDPAVPYRDFDLVYCYGLHADPHQDASIKREITDRMRPGGLFFTARRPFPDWLQHTGGLIWRKQA